MPYPIIQPIFFPVYNKTTNLTVNVKKENQIKGFSFTPNCKGFVITNPKKAYLWAYYLGLGWDQSRGDIYTWLYSFFDPSSACINYFRQNYDKMSKRDALFYVKLILSYMRGLLKSGFMDRNWLRQEWEQFRINMIDKFNLNWQEIPNNL